MRTTAIVFIALLTLLAAGTALAGPPLAGSYDDVDNGGSVFLGRYTEGWDAGGAAVNAGTTLNATSWSDPDLGTQWHYWCATENSDGFLWQDNVNAEGYGNRTYLKTFTGGQIWLSGDGPWANGDPEYTGTIESYTETEIVTYEAWEAIAAVTSVQAQALFEGYAMCMTFYIGNGARVGTTDLGQVKPAGFPDFLDPNCDATRTLGAWWDFDDITLVISGDCSTPTGERTWGALKANYRD